MSNLNRLKNVFSTILEIEEEQVNEDLKYDGNSVWDSINHMFLITELENEFSVEIDPDDILEIKSFKQTQDVLGKYDIEF